ncbi:MAG: hypothetical protein IID44_14190 [Planctomycetes bacterium]|nr:hypothetical protein [Planctomycetota bacterium]
MCAARRRKSARFPQLGWFLRFTHGRGLGVALALLSTTAVVIGAVALWDNIGGEILTGPEYYVDPQDIQITPPPRWVHSDVKGEVLENRGLSEPLWIFDEGLAKRIADEFLLHPWVAEVVRVRKHHPAAIEVELTYRKPVAMVMAADESRLLPVDVNAVVLPRKDFSEVEIERYPRIATVRSRPQAPVGEAWQDPHVLDGAKIGAALLEVWKKLRLAQIVPVETDRRRSGRRDRIYALETRRGKRIVWGHVPGAETLGELNAEEKVAKLLRYVQKHRSLDGGHNANVPRLYRQEQQPEDPHTATGGASEVR